MANKFRIVFLGTGVSTAIPNIRHVLDMDKDEKCSVCSDALNTPESKNKRNNVSIAIIYETNDEPKQRKCYLVDAGKTLRDVCLKTFVKYSITEVNGILLTHGHADAIGGMDDLRDLQHFQLVEVQPTNTPHSQNGLSSISSNDPVKGFQILSGPMNIYLTEKTMETVSSAYPYLIMNQCQPCYLDSPTNTILARRIAYLQYHVIEEFHHLFFDNCMNIQSFPVYHGGTYVSLGFSIGQENEFIYISDLKIIPKETWSYLKEGVSRTPIRYLVLDCLNWTGIYPHIGFDEVVEIVKDLEPEIVYLTGMSCGMGSHDEIEDKIHNIYGMKNCFVAYDGLCIDNLSL